MQNIRFFGQALIKSSCPRKNIPVELRRSYFLPRPVQVLIAFGIQHGYVAIFCFIDHAVN